MNDREMNSFIPFRTLQIHFSFYPIQNIANPLFIFPSNEFCIKFTFKVSQYGLGVVLLTQQFYKRSTFRLVDCFLIFTTNYNTVFILLHKSKNIWKTVHIVLCVNIVITTSEEGGGKIKSDSNTFTTSPTLWTFQ